MTSLPRNNFKITWVDKHRRSTEVSNPTYPSGIDVDLSAGDAITCTADIPYPPPQPLKCGYWVVTCAICGTNAIATCAGRADDPRSIKVSCKP